MIFRRLCLVKKKAMFKVTKKVVDFFYNMIFKLLFFHKKNNNKIYILFQEFQQQNRLEWLENGAMLRSLPFEMLQ